MTEAEWLTCDDAPPLMWHLKDQVTNRKWHLLAVSCWRRVWALLTEGDRLGVEIAERFIEGEASEEEMKAALNDQAPPYVGPASRIVAEPACSIITHTDDAQWVAKMSVENSMEVSTAFAQDEATACTSEGSAQAALVRDIFGNPFRPVTFSPAWRTDTAVAIARQMYEFREFGAMPILADALQDAGCDNDDILSHCRDANQVHVRGCWVVDLVLGKE